MSTRYVWLQYKREVSGHTFTGETEKKKLDGILENGGRYSTFVRSFEQNYFSASLGSVSSMSVYSDYYKPHEINVYGTTTPPDVIPSAGEDADSISEAQELGYSGTLSSFTLLGSFQTEQLKNSATNEIAPGFTIPEGYYFILVADNATSLVEAGSLVDEYYYLRDDGFVWFAENETHFSIGKTVDEVVGNSGFLTFSWSETNKNNLRLILPAYSTVYAPGTQNGSVSGPSQSTYPDDGVSGNYWYTYQGQDNIDPGAVSIPSDIKGGKAINITVTPGSGKRYGGTVSYIYEVQLNGGSWTQVSATTATSVSYTVPKGTETIRARVHARDDLGFTSSTYVQSNQVAVQNSNVHVGVNGVVRNAETVVCVGGVIRTADCYACVNGVIRSC